MQSLATINGVALDPVPCRPTLLAFKWPSKCFHIPSGWQFQLGQQGLLHTQATGAAWQPVGSLPLHTHAVLIVCCKVFQMSI